MVIQTLSIRPPFATSSARTRYLGHHHFAFLRGWIQGLPLRDLAKRYLETGTDLRVAKSQLAWLRAEMVALAARSPQPGLSGLLRRSARAPDAPTTASASAPLPSLDQFAARFPDGFYSENELAQLFAEEYAARLTPSERRRARLAERQLAALRYLEPLTAVPPQGTDGVDAWFIHAVAARLANAGLTTLLHIQDCYRLCGARWWIDVPRLGASGADRIVRWWSQHESSLGTLAQFRRDTMPDPAWSTTTPVRPGSYVSTAQMVVPLEYMLTPSELSGADGSNRQITDRCKLLATNDYDAILAWLSTRPKPSATWRSYRREAERFLLWARVERNKAFSSINIEDCIEFRDFLNDPQPAFRWVGSGSRPRWSSQWRPFAGPLSASSAQHTQTVLRLLCEWLVRQRYLDTNPWDGVLVIARNRIRLKIGRSFTQDQWATVQQFLENLPTSPGSVRLQFLVPFLYATGLRLNEMAAAQVRQLQYSAEAGGWMLHVLGTGLIAREVPLASDTTALLMAYLATGNPAALLDIDPSLERMIARLDPELPLLRRIEDRRDGNAKLSGSAVYKALKGFFVDVANRSALLSEKDRRLFAEASTHWLRHTFATHAVADGAPLDIIRDVMGHASISTTSIYASAEQKRSIAQMEHLATLRVQRAAELEAAGSL